MTNHQRFEAVNPLELVLPLAIFLLLLLLNRPRKHMVFGDDHKQRQVYGEDAFTQNRPLPAALAVASQERLCVLKVIAIHKASKGLRRRKRVSVASIDVTDLALGNHHQRLFVDAVLPREKAQMQTAP